MNHKPQSFPVFPWLTGLAVFAGAAAVFVQTIAAGIADEPKPPESTTEGDQKASSEATPAPADAKTLPAADEILTQLRSKLEGLDSLKCELHQTALISGMKLTAFGRYVEASGNRVNLQFLIFPFVSSKAEDAQALALDAPAPVIDEADNRGMLHQVSDGNVLYSLWKNGDNTNITRRSIPDILAAAEATGVYDQNRAAMDLGIGGLRGLISRLQTTMEFAPVKSVKVGEREVFEVTGRWNTKVRKEVFRLPDDSIVDPRPQVPEYVRVYVDAETMLPRRIQFLKRSLDATQKMVRPLITLDLRNLVLNEPVDDKLFVFTPPENIKKEDLIEQDLTEQVIRMIQESVKPPQTEAAPTNPAVGASPTVPPGK